MFGCGDRGARLTAESIATPDSRQPDFFRRQNPPPARGGPSRLAIRTAQAARSKDQLFQLAPGVRQRGAAAQ